MVAIGLPQGPNVTFPVEISRLVRRAVKITGSYGARPSRDMPELIRLVERGAVSISKEITRRYRLEEANEAFEVLRRGEVIGRSIVEF